MTSANYIGFFTLLSFTLLACGGDTGGDTGGGTTVAATTAAESTGDVPTTEPETTAEPETTGGPGTTGPDTTGDATTGGGIADCGFDDGVVYDRLAEIFQLVSADGETCVWLERRDDSEPDTIYKAVPFTLLQFKAGHAGGVEHLTDAAKMTWESTHHNWEDVGEAWSDAVRYRLEDWFAKDGAFESKYGLFAYDEQTDELLWGPIELAPYAP